MSVVQRLVTTADVDDATPDDRHVSVAARHEAVLGDGRRVLLLDDRGWGSTQPWTTASAEDIATTTRTVVGPDEPAEGRTWEQAQADHWGALGRILRGHDVIVEARELARLPHEVVLGARLLARLAREPGAAARRVSEASGGPAQTESSGSIRELRRRRSTTFRTPPG